MSAGNKAAEVVAGGLSAIGAFTGTATAPNDVGTLTDQAAEVKAAESKQEADDLGKSDSKSGDGKK